MKFIKKLYRFSLFNPFDRRLRQLKKIYGASANILITWNRGLGDIPLGLYALVHRIRTLIPQASITFLTREDLKDGFHLLSDVKVLVGSEWKRGTPFDLDATLKSLHLSSSDFDWVFENPDPTRWFPWQLGHLVPKMEWRAEWDHLCERFPIEQGCVGVHVQTETIYGYEKNWPLAHWEELFRKLIEEEGKQVVVFGFKKEPPLHRKGIVDLRGETSLYEMLSIIKNRCTCLVVPDSGVLSISYYLNVTFPIRVVSLWADPRQGVLKQNVASPNQAYEHFPLVGAHENVAAISVEEVMNRVKC